MSSKKPIMVVCRCQARAPEHQHTKRQAIAVREPAAGGRHARLGAAEETGAPEEIRTPDPQIRSLVLYPAELRARRGLVAIGFDARWQGSQSIVIAGRGQRPRARNP